MFLLDIDPPPSRPPIIPPPWTRNHFPQVWDKAPDAGASGTLSSRMGAVESALLLLFLLPGAGLLLRGSGLSRARVLRTLARRGLVPRRRLRTGCGCGARLRSAPGSACRRLVVEIGSASWR